MDQRLNQAISAARAGETRNAQRLLADVLKDDPDQVQAWFLLSHLVDAPEQQTAYLSKVLTLEPGHQQARQRLAWLRSGATGGAVGSVPQPVTMPYIPIAEEGMDFLAQAEADTLPSWMSADDVPAQEIRVTAVPLQQPAKPPAEPLPDWLQTPVDQTWVEGKGKPVAEVAEPPSPAPKPVKMPIPKPTKPTPTAKPDVTRWNLLLILLVVVAVLVAILLVRSLLAL